MESQIHTRHSYKALFFRRARERVSEAQMVCNYRNLLLSKTNGIETTRRYHFVRSEKNIWIWHKIVRVCSMHELGHHAIYFADTVFGIHTLESRETSGRRQNQSIPIHTAEWRFGILCLNFSLFYVCLLFEAWTMQWTKTKENKEEEDEKWKKLVLISLALITGYILFCFSCFPSDKCVSFLAKRRQWKYSRRWLVIIQCGGWHRTLIHWCLL